MGALLRTHLLLHKDTDQPYPTLMSAGALFLDEWWTLNLDVAVNTDPSAGASTR